MKTTSQQPLKTQLKLTTSTINIRDRTMQDHRFEMQTTITNMAIQQAVVIVGALLQDQSQLLFHQAEAEVNERHAYLVVQTHDMYTPQTKTAMLRHNTAVALQHNLPSHATELLTYTPEEPSLIRAIVNDITIQIQEIEQMMACVFTTVCILFEVTPAFQQMTEQGEQILILFTLTH